ncbi:MAG: hypothetical protein WBC37_06725 [Burkholderiaceae bacterium]
MKRHDEAALHADSIKAAFFPQGKVPIDLQCNAAHAGPVVSQRRSSRHRKRRTP